MEFTSRMTTSVEHVKIVDDLTNGQIGDFDLGVLFLSANDASSVSDILEQLRSRINVHNLIGCTCAGIIGDHAEIERQNATSLILARLPGVKILPFVLTQPQLEGLKAPDDWYNFFEVFPNEKPVFVTLPDPFSLDMGLFLEGVNKAYAGCPVVGGLASAAAQPGENILFVNKEETQDGVVGVVLTGDIRVSTVVSQGCRPIGETYIITKAEGNLIHTLAGRPFLEVLQEVLNKLSTADQSLAQDAIFVGIAMNEYKDKFKRGDFLIRGLMGLDQSTGAGVVADYVEVGQTVQFHLRDAKTANEDLNELLTLENQKEQAQKPKGALVFCCNGRGEYLFKQKNHDIAIIQKQLGPIPAAGFFCAGEIGPVGASNFLHGFTNSIALFYPKKEGGAVQRPRADEFRRRVD